MKEPPMFSYETTKKSYIPRTIITWTLEQLELHYIVKLKKARKITNKKTFFVNIFECLR